MYPVTAGALKPIDGESVREGNAQPKASVIFPGYMFMVVRPSWLMSVATAAALRFLVCQSARSEVGGEKEGNSGSYVLQIYSTQQQPS